MKGNNVLTLCEAQMQTIVQEWIDRNVVTRPKVTSVKAERGSGYASGGFEVMLSDEERPELEDGPIYGWVIGRGGGGGGSARVAPPKMEPEDVVDEVHIPPPPEQ